MANARWTSVADWNSWDGNPRVINKSVKIPYSRIAHLGSGFAGQPGSRWEKEILSTPIAAVAGEVKALWRVGQYYTSGNTDIANTNLMSITADIEPSATELGQRLSHATNVPVRSETTEIGIYCESRNGYAEINELNTSFIAYPMAGKNFYAGCWFKSLLLDYSDGIGYILVHRDNSSQGIAFAVYIDTDNKIKAKVKGVAAPIVISSEIEVDLEWHYVLLASESPSAVGNHYLFIDNELVGSANSQSEEISTSRGFCVKSINIGIGFNGLAGAVDEIVIGEYSGNISMPLSNYRFDPIVITSPVVDTEIHNAMMTQLTCDYGTPSNTTVAFAFRSNNDAVDILSDSWSGYTSPMQVESKTPTNMLSLGIKGRYAQIRIRLSPSTETILRQYETPKVSFLEAVYETASQTINFANSAFLPGQVLGQQVNFSGTKYVDKLSVDLTISKKNPVYYITGQADVLSFLSACFSEYRNPEQFQIADGEEVGVPKTGCMLYNKAQASDYVTPEEASSNSPYLKYHLLFSYSGVYDLWCFGKGEIYWCFDDNTSDMRKATIGGLYPKWTKFGVFLSETGQIHTFSVYLADAASTEESVFISQWYFTTNRKLESVLDDGGEEAYTTPLPLSPSPFTIALTLSSHGSSNVITLWKPSLEISDSGRFNFQIPTENRSFVDGLTIEFRQFGGNANYCAMWNYSRSEKSVGPAYRREGIGEDIEWEP